VNKILIELAAPPALTVICWLASRLVAAVRRGKVRPLGQFWLLLISAYVMFALALWGGRSLATHERDDPSPELVR
jgi:hypothetical protein